MPQYVDGVCEYSRQTALSMLAAADPWTEAQPCYVVFQQELTGENRSMPAGAAMVYSPTKDTQLKGELRAMGRWRGRGFCCVVREVPRQTDDPVFLGKVAHEYAHHVDAVVKELFVASDTATETFCRSEFLGISLSHDQSWMRAFVHLLSRAGQAGYHPALAESVACPDWLPPLSECVRTLTAEINAGVGRPLVNVLREKAASAYVALWGRR